MFSRPINKYLGHFLFSHIINNISVNILIHISMCIMWKYFCRINPLRSEIALDIAKRAILLSK